MDKSASLAPFQADGNGKPSRLTGSYTFGLCLVCFASGVVGVGSVGVVGTRGGVGSAGGEVVAAVVGRAAPATWQEYGRSAGRAGRSAGQARWAGTLGRARSHRCATSPRREEGQTSSNRRATEQARSCYCFIAGDA